jgi:quercetin dioxygenase-like cupin family protein
MRPATTRRYIVPVYNFEELPDVTHNPGLSSGHGQTIKGERIFFGKRTKKAGTSSKPHHHPNEQFFYILEGKLSVEIDGERQVAVPGEVVHIPANAVHSSFADDGQDVEYLYIKDTTWGLKGVAAGETTPEVQPEDDPF